jgi:hypothetical protein
MYNHLKRKNAMEEFKSARFVHVLPPWFGGEEHHQRRKMKHLLVRKRSYLLIGRIDTFL